ncbi:MAG: methyltransferase FkbM family [Mucilaginibacter sp.]|nr:methyltransferase FkbM family [Mucilaginibacter sp.]
MIERIFRKINREILLKLAGKKKYQNLFEELNSLSLRGMNIGGGGAVNSSGEFWALNYINQKLKNINELTIFDVGANIGDYSILLQNTFGEKAHIYSFEPSGKTFNKLNLNLIDLTNINTFNFGFGDKNEKINLFRDSDESPLASVYNRRLEHFSIKMNKVEEIEIRTIDEFCLENQIKHIHFLKLDAEGHEMNILKGTPGLLRSGAIDFIQFEFGGCNIDSKTFFQDFYYLLRDNYYLYRIVQDGLYKIEHYKEMYESFITTNYIAERINYK